MKSVVEFSPLMIACLNQFRHVTLCPLFRRSGGVCESQAQLLIQTGYFAHWVHTSTKKKERKKSESIINLIINNLLLRQIERSWVSEILNSRIFHSENSLRVLESRTILELIPGPISLRWISA